jgi:hypothetical protein
LEPGEHYLVSTEKTGPVRVVNNNGSAEVQDFSQCIYEDEEYVNWETEEDTGREVKVKRTHLHCIFCREDVGHRDEYDGEDLEMELHPSHSCSGLEVAIEELKTEEKLQLLRENKSIILGKKGESIILLKFHQEKISHEALEIESQDVVVEVEFPEKIKKYQCCQCNVSSMVWREFGKAMSRYAPYPSPEAYSCETKTLVNACWFFQADIEEIKMEIAKKATLIEEDRYIPIF